LSTSFIGIHVIFFFTAKKKQKKQKQKQTSSMLDLNGNHGMPLITTPPTPTAKTFKQNVLLGSIHRHVSTRGVARAHRAIAFGSLAWTGWGRASSTRPLLLWVEYL
jgi:hypothetical protein